MGNVDAFTVLDEEDKETQQWLYKNDFTMYLIVFSLQCHIEQLYFNILNILNISKYSNRLSNIKSFFRWFAS